MPNHFTFQSTAELTGERVDRYSAYTYIATEQPANAIVAGDVVTLTGSRPHTGTVTAASAATVTVEGAGEFSVATFGDVIPYTDGMIGTRIGLKAH